MIVREHKSASERAKFVRQFVRATGGRGEACFVLVRTVIKCKRTAPRS